MDSSFRKRKRRMPKAAVFVDQLRRLIAQGVPEGEAVEALLRDMPRGRFKEAVRRVASRLKSGLSLSSSLSGFPRYFAEGFVSIVEAGEKSGDLPRALELASAYLKRRDVSPQRIFLGIFLPVLTTFVCLGVMQFWQLMLLPALEGTQADFSSEGMAISAAPQLTRLFDTALIVFGGLMVSLLIVFFAVLYYPARRNVTLYRFCSLLQILLEGKLPLEECHRLARKGFSGVSFRVKRAVDNLFKSLYRGETMADAFARTRYFRGVLSWMIAAGERKGEIPGALSQAAAFHEIRADSRLSLLFNVVPPVLTIAIAIPVAILGMSLFGFLRWVVDVAFSLIP